MPRIVLAATVLLSLGALLRILASVSPTAIDEHLSGGQNNSEILSLEEAIDSAFHPIWPTNTGRRINSSFAEFRATHFHAGIDISTNNRTGYPVYAAEDGYVATVRVSPSGYGKAVYLRHKNGYFTVYAHLKTFNELLNSVVEELQYREKKYAIRYRFEPNDIIVRKGDVIAFTGDTGTGSAHLHFEIRDQDFNPINPLLFENLRPSDTTPPILRGLAASPLSFRSTVGGDHEPRFFSLRRKNDYLYELSTPVYATGDIGLSIEARDRADRSRRNLGIHRVELQIDGGPVYASEYNRIIPRHSKQVALHFDRSLLSQHRRRHRNLYVERGDALEWYEPDGANRSS